jgi:Holliday junction resolvase RusA-like endonuclease
MRVTFNQIPPSKKNSKILVCRGKYPLVLPSKLYEDWHTETLWKLKKHRPKKPIEKCEIACDFYFPNNRKRDLENIYSSIADILVDAQIIKDDSWQNIETALLYARGIDKENPRVLCEIN